MTGSVLFEYEKENNSIRDTLIEAVSEGAYLMGADLIGADLRGAYLTGANLRGAGLIGADLRGASLIGADLRGAYLTGANLRGANLAYAYLRDTDLTGAYLADANLRGADLIGADLRGADLGLFKKDFFDVLLRAIPEINNLKNALINGKIDGSAYTGECACLCGTLEKSDSIEIKKRIYDLRDSSRPIEIFFTLIRPGDTPENNYPAKVVLEWIEEFEELIKPIY